MVGDAPAHPCRSARRQCGRGECLGNRFQRKPGIQPLEQVIPIHTQLPAIRQINLDDFRLDEDLFLGPVEHGHHIANPLDDIGEIRHDHGLGPLVRPELADAVVLGQHRGDLRFNILHLGILQDIVCGDSGIDPLIRGNFSLLDDIFHFPDFLRGINQDKGGGAVIEDNLPQGTFHFRQQGRHPAGNRRFKLDDFGLLALIEPFAILFPVFLVRHDLQDVPLHLIRQVVRRQDNLQRVGQRHILDHELGGSRNFLANDDVEVRLFRQELEEVHHLHGIQQVEGDFLVQAGQMVFADQVGLDFRRQGFGRRTRSIGFGCLGKSHGGEPEKHETRGV